MNSEADPNFRHGASYDGVDMDVSGKMPYAKNGDLEKNAYLWGPPSFLNSV